MNFLEFVGTAFLIILFVIALGHIAGAFEINVELREKE